MSDKGFVIRCRALIIHDGRLLVVKHTPESTFYALPGGHLEWGEGIKECMSREIEEELGIKAELGRLFYVNTFMDEEVQSIEFFFEVKNSKDYADLKKLTGTHSSEIHEFRWVGKNDDARILPPGIDEALKNGTLESDSVRFIKG